MSHEFNTFAPHTWELSNNDYIITQLMATWQNCTGSLLLTKRGSNSYPWPQRGTCQENGQVVVIDETFKPHHEQKVLALRYHKKNLLLLSWVSECVSFLHTPFDLIWRTKMASHEQSYRAGEAKGRNQVTNYNIQFNNSILFHATSYLHSCLFLPYNFYAISI